MNDSLEQLTDFSSKVRRYRSPTIVAIGIVLGGIAVYSFGSLLLAAMMWLVVAVALAATACSGYLASRATDIGQHSRLSMFGGGAALMAIVMWWLIPAGGTATRATWAYWTELSRIGRQGEAFNDKASEPPNLAAAIEMLKQGAKTCEQMAAEISDLPTYQVDPAVVELGANQVEILQESTLITREMRSLVEQDQELQGAATSTAVLVESFVRGMLGDPLGQTRESAISDQQLSAK